MEHMEFKKTRVAPCAHNTLAIPGSMTLLLTLSWLGRNARLMPGKSSSFKLSLTCRKNSKTRSPPISKIALTNKSSTDFGTEGHD